MVLDLRIPQNQHYQQDVLDKAVVAVPGRRDRRRDRRCKQITDGWNEITDEQGRDKQLAAYKASLGVQR